MTLSAEYIETIEQYLLSWELKYREFYDEILDHYCTDIERQMNDGFNFDVAFEQTNQKFSKYYYTQKNGPEWINEVTHHYGPKAFEAEYVDGFRKTFNQKFKVYFLDAFRTYRIGFFGTLGMLFFYCFSNHIFESKAIFIAILYVPLITYYFAIINEWVKNGNKYKLSLLFFTKNEDMIEKKRSKLFPNVKLGILQQYFMLPMTLLPLYVPTILNLNKLINSTLSIEIKTGLLTLYFVYSWVVIRLITENTSAWNLMKFKK